MTLKSQKALFTRQLEERNRTEMDNIRRSWKLKCDEMDRSKKSVDIQYESLLTRLEGIISATEAKIIHTREESKKIRDEISNMKKSIGQSKAAIELRETDESSEIEIELRLQMQVNELKQRLQYARAETANANDKFANYKSMYLKVINKQRKIQERRENEKNLHEIRYDLNESLKLFKERIAKEHLNLDEDLRKLREMRENLIHPKPPKKSPQEEYRKYLLEAGQWVDEHQASFMRTDENAIYLKEPELIEDSDSNLPVNDNFTHISQNLDENVLDQIELLENNIRILLSTGNYKEEDALISNLRKQIEELKGQRRK